METKNDSAVISDREFIALLKAAKQHDAEAALQLIALYREDMLRISKYIQLPEEDVVSHIVLEFLEMIQTGG
ncbi:hypothetical protein EBB07_17165 [Paenibacillaceae bacterium]|nr:hypothetical protein EBB07_17165 [Paenibacillaceae bacterium]